MADHTVAVSCFFFCKPAIFIIYSIILFKSGTIERHTLEKVEVEILAQNICHNGIFNSCLCPASSFHKIRTAVINFYKNLYIFI